MSSIHHQIMLAEQRWHLQFKRKTSNEASSSCPFCRQGEDRFLVFAEGNYFCRQCAAKGWVDEKDRDYKKLTDTERRLLALEAEQRQAQREREENARRLSALERMHSSTDHLKYHENLSWQAIDYWHGEGITNESIDFYQLGFCPRCPTDREGRPSYTIPVFDRDSTTLINIRHRLVGANGGDKYRPHLAGLGAQLFNARFTNGTEQRDSITITEGEKKSVVLQQEGFANVGIMGKRCFKREWLEWLEPFRTVCVALDPDATESAERLAGMLKGRGRVVDLPVKADEFFWRYHGTANDFERFLGLARPVKQVRD